MWLRLASVAHQQVGYITHTQEFSAFLPLEWPAARPPSLAKLLCTTARIGGGWRMKRKGIRKEPWKHDEKKCFSPHFFLKKSRTGTRGWCSIIERLHVKLLTPKPKPKSFSFSPDEDNIKISWTWNFSTIKDGFQLHLWFGHGMHSIFICVMCVHPWRSLVLVWLARRL